MSGRFPSLAEVLAAHSIRQDYNHPAWGKCRCGFDPDPGWDDDAMTDEEINSWPSQSQHQAEMWREACTVTTLEQLDALPNFSVVGLPTASGHIFAIEKDDGWCGVDSSGLTFDRDELAAVLETYGPASLLHHPDWSAT